MGLPFPLAGVTYHSETGGVKMDQGEKVCSSLSRPALFLSSELRVPSFSQKMRKSLLPSPVQGKKTLKQPVHFSEHVSAVLDSSSVKYYCQCLPS